jgi:LmbE family N-acetylglucosaminyl deacetylase
LQTGAFADRRLLCFFAHPDDEAYSAGGTIAMCAQGGAQVAVVCATRGEAGQRRGGAGDEPLAAVRSAELSAACDVLGAQRPRFLEQADGRVAVTPEAAEALADELRRFEPEVVVGHGADGAYGHRDHLACVRLLDAARVRAGCEARVLHVAFPLGLFAVVHRALMRHAPQLLALRDPARLGAKPDAVDLRLPLAGWREQKLAAVAAHASQLVDSDPHSFLRRGLIDSLLDEEWFVHAGGAPLPRDARDPFAGL